MAKSDQPSTSTRSKSTSPDKPVKIGKKEVAGLTEDELKKVSGGYVRKAGGSQDC